MLQPKRTKHRKAQKGRIRQVAKRGATISFGSFALKALEPIWMTNRQIEAARQALTRSMKREGNVWIRVFPDKPVTRKPQEVRMGKGKGNPEFCMLKVCHELPSIFVSPPLVAIQTIVLSKVISNTKGLGKFEFPGL